MKSSLDENKRAFILLKIIRFAFIAAIALLCVAGALSGSNIHISRHLTQAGYVTLAVVLGLMTVELLHLYTQKHRIAPERHIVCSPSTQFIWTGCILTGSSSYSSPLRAFRHLPFEQSMDFFALSLLMTCRPSGIHLLGQRWRLL
jgi:hypothetical protein